MVCQHSREPETYGQQRVENVRRTPCGEPSYQYV